MFFFEARRLGASRHKESLTARIERIRQENQEASGFVRQIHDLWPDCPPDWDERRDLVRARDKYVCVECGVGHTLQVHHRRAIREGGTHRTDNLVLQCERCHLDAHGGRQFNYEKERRDGEALPTKVQQRIALINLALAQGVDVRSRYRKRDGTITKRTVTLRELRKLTVSELRNQLGKGVRIEGRKIVPIWILSPTLCETHLCYR
jgi:hypothetical protein